MALDETRDKVHSQVMEFQKSLEFRSIQVVFSGLIILEKQQYKINNLKGPNFGAKSKQIKPFVNSLTKTQITCVQKNKKKTLIAKRLL